MKTNTITHTVYQLPHTMREGAMSEAYLDAVLDGKISLEVLPCYEKRAVVQANTLAGVWEETNTTVHATNPNIKMLSPIFHSVSVGDIVVNTLTNIWYVCVPSGWEVLTLTQTQP